MRTSPISTSHPITLPRILSVCALAVLVGCSSQSFSDAGDARGAAETGETETDALIVGGCPLGKPLISKPCFTCDPLPAGNHSVGCGGPLPTLWGWDGSGIATGVVYPPACTVYLPVENPSFPGKPQPCICEQLTDGPPPTWMCPI